MPASWYWYDLVSTWDREKVVFCYVYYVTSESLLSSFRIRRGVIGDLMIYQDISVAPRAGKSTSASIILLSPYVHGSVAMDIIKPRQRAEA